MRFFRHTAPATMPALHIGADSLKKPHHIVTLQFSEVVKDHGYNMSYIHGIETMHLRNRVLVKPTKFSKLPKP